MTHRRAGALITAFLILIGLLLQPSAAAAASKHQLWESRLDASTGAKALAVSPDGTQVFVTGDTDIGVGSVVTAAYEVSSGTLQWTFTHQAIADYDIPAAIAVSPDGTFVFVTAESWDGSDFDFLTLAYDTTTGTELWAVRYDHGRFDYPKALAVSADGANVYVLGSVYGSNGDDFALLSYDAATGDESWATILSSQAGEDVPNDLGVSPDGSTLYATGIGEGSGGVHDFLTVAFDASTGRPSWVSRYHDPSQAQDQAYSLAVSPSGAQVFVTGCMSDVYGGGRCAGTPDYQTVAYDSATGSRQWVRTYNGPVNGVDVASSVGVSADGLLVFVTGDSDQLATTDYVTIAYEASAGNERWFAAYDGPTNRVEGSCCMAVSPNRARIVVTGWSSGFGTTEWATVAYDPATGRRLWSATYRGFKYYNYPAAIGTNTSGKLAFIAGQITANTKTGYEWAVVAYRG